MMDAISAYRRIGIAQPASHQLEAWEALLRGESIVLRAPTGSGKTEAVLLPFLAGSDDRLPGRLVYTLPLRSVTAQIKERADRYKGYFNPHLDVRVQHGQQPESVLFTADVVVATIDQVVSSYACAPLTLPVRHGNIPAGAIVSSVLVFDEVHLLDPRLGLQAIRILCKRLGALGLPFAVMTATLPTGLLGELAQELAAHVITSTQEFVSRTCSIEFKQEQLTRESVEAMLDCEFTRVLVVCNTVDRAINLYRAVKSSASARGYACELLHSRFLPEDRQRKEEWIRQYFGKNGEPARALLIATQVVEVGLDISADVVMSELAPIDALVQRIGRAARWGGVGEVWILDVPSHEPYAEELVAKTRRALLSAGRWEFSWPIVQKLIDDILTDPLLAAWVKPEFLHKVFFRLCEAAFTGGRGRVPETIRDQDTVQVSIVDMGISCDTDSLRIPWIDVPIGTARRWIHRSRERGIPVLRLQVDMGHVRDDAAVVSLTELKNERIVFGDRLVFQSRVVRYDSELGLVSDGELGEGLKPRGLSQRSRLESDLPYETWFEHIAKVRREVQELLVRERFVVRSLARLLDCSSADVEYAALLAAVLHDLGKLTVEWQRAAGVSVDAPTDRLLAHTGKLGLTLPPHATVSAYSCDCAVHTTYLPAALKRAVVFALAHHHSVRAREVPTYTLHPAWREALSHQLDSAGLQGLLHLDRVIVSQRSRTSLGNRMPRFDYERDYNAYVILARWLRLADRVATGGIDALRRYENWFGLL